MCKAEGYLGGGEMMAMAGEIYRRRFSGQAVCSRDDLIMEGVAGIIEAGERYDGGRASFTTYAWWCALWQMLRFFKAEKERLGQVSLNDEVGDGIELGDILFNTEWEGKNNDNDDNKIIGGLIKVAKDKSCKDFEILMGLLEGKKQREIAKDFGVTKQSISKVFCNFKDYVRENYDVVDGEIVSAGLTK